MKQARHATVLAALIALAAAARSAIAPAAAAEEITIGIGHQSMCTDTYPAGVVLENLHLLEKYLPHSGKYRGVTYRVAWKDYDSGPPITNMMIAGKLEFGVMGDYPLIVNGAKFQATGREESLYVAGTGYNLRGEGNGLVAPVQSNIYSLADLKGKTVSTPVGSASWGMLLKALQDAHMNGEVNIVSQSPSVGAANIAADKIAAHADFCPWSELMEYRGSGRMIYNGVQTGVPYLHGVVVRKDFAAKYPEVVVAFIKAMIAGDRWVEADPVRAVTAMQSWTGMPKEVLYLYYSKGGVLTLDPTIKPYFVKTLEFDYQVLRKGKNIPSLDFAKWVDDRFVREACKEMGLDYDRLVAVTVDPESANRGLPDEVWIDGRGIEDFADPAAMLEGVAVLMKAGRKIDATYVYDAATGVKIFGKSAYYVRSASGALTAFMLEPDAMAFSKRTGGTLLSYAQALSAPALAAALARPANTAGMARN
ncbi:MAG: ABC transporter substrate-binding protein [Gammaproteobacteria bacterium]|nr:ABC transporter substrate-binding protein [Gammaproteobacteria bacterium]